MPEGWEWDETLFEGSAPYYAQGRLPYPSGLHDAFAGALDLSGSPRLLDVGCGPGIVALTVADLFAEVVGVDPDGAMLAEAERQGRRRGLGNLRWVRRRAEELPAGLGSFRCAVFAQSFHWMDRERVASTVFDMLEPGGAFVHLNTAVAAPPDPPPLPFPVPPPEEIDALCQSYLGEARRAGRGFLPTAHRAGKPTSCARWASCRPASCPSRDARCWSAASTTSSPPSSRPRAAPHTCSAPGARRSRRT